MPEDAKPLLLVPRPELPDDTPIELLDLPPKLRQILKAAGLQTAGATREIADEVHLSFRNFSAGSVAYLRETLGLPSCDGVRPTTVNVKK
jgi:hypothetical protein